MQIVSRGRAAPMALLVAITLALAGCGGGSANKDKAATPKGSTVAATKNAKGKPAIDAALPAADRKKSLLGDTGLGGTVGVEESYQPTGEIIADSGFRPAVDGFGFENYGNDVGPENMTAANVAALFGDQVCIGGDSEDCQLIPPAQRWMDNENARMAGGHCMGFSVAALRMYEETLDVTNFGADQTSDLEIQGNVDLQESIAEHWVYQDLPGIKAKIVTGTPTGIINKLVDALNSGDEAYTLGILMADGGGGHAITPFAVEDKGDGTAEILVYDNNFPGITRAVDVDTNDDTWHYVGGTNPKDLGEVYEGDASTKSMILLPTSPGEDIQPCPFCDGEQSGDGGDLGSVLPKGQRYSEITLGGYVTNHPHLVLSDDKDRQTGIVDGKLKQEIPGVKVVQNLSVRNWEAAPEPKFQVPEGQDIQMTIDGSSLERKTKTKIDLVGNGLVIAIEEIEIAPGQQDLAYISGGGEGLYYQANGKGEATPELYAGLTDGDEAYTFAATALGVKKGSTIGMLVDKKSRTVLLDADGSKGVLPGGKGIFALIIGKATANDALTWVNDDLELNGKKGEGVYFNYGKSLKKGRSIKLDVGPEDGPYRTAKAKYSP